MTDCNCAAAGTPALPRYAVYDARGIFVTYACDKCRADKTSGYRPEIFTNPGYEADEPIEPEDY